MNVSWSVFGVIQLNFLLRSLWMKFRYISISWHVMMFSWMFRKIKNNNEIQEDDKDVMFQEKTIPGKCPNMSYRSWNSVWVDNIRFYQQKWDKMLISQRVRSWMIPRILRAYFTFTPLAPQVVIIQSFQSAQSTIHNINFTSNMKLIEPKAPHLPCWKVNVQLKGNPTIKLTIAHFPWGVKIKRMNQLSRKWWWLFVNWLTDTRRVVNGAQYILGEEWMMLHGMKRWNCVPQSLNLITFRDK